MTRELLGVRSQLLYCSSFPRLGPEHRPDVINVVRDATGGVNERAKLVRHEPETEWV